jgi:hypothetical protein
MANARISELPAATTAQTSDEVPVNQGGATKKVTLAQMASALEVGAGITQLTGDGTAGPGVGAQPFTLSASGVTAGVYGDSGHIPILTVNAKGLVTAASTTVASGGGGGTTTGALTLLEQHTASASSFLNFTSFVDPTLYEEYLIEIVNVVTSPADRLVFQFSTNGGTSYDTTAVYNNESYETVFAGGAQARGNSTVGAMDLRPGANLTLPANTSWNCSLRLMKPTSTDQVKICFGQVTFWAAAGQWATSHWMGWYNNLSSVNALRFGMFGGGTITSGTIRIYGLAK